jgi:hypothetical protein
MYESKPLCTYDLRVDARGPYQELSLVSTIQHICAKCMLYRVQSVQLSVCRQTPLEILTSRAVVRAPPALRSGSKYMVCRMPRWLL